ncbi:MAG TPA: DUF3142 domain-containing protein [Acidobacteriota bacterium]|nr:DUF3142 domain-containing protein [Acidobacteriota bacterium]
MDGFPPVMVWAWEREEDLRFLDCSQMGIAYLAGTLQLQDEEALMRPRFQPLRAPQGCRMMAVVRIESRSAALSLEQRQEAVKKILAVVPLERAHGLQIDFDARLSERGFYRALLQDLRREIPAQWPLSMTALASWCLYDGWLGGLPVDEAVPMLFHMGADGPRVRSFLDSGRDFRPPSARGSYGLYSRDTAPRLRPGRRLYLFHPEAWGKASLNTFLARVRP